MTLGRQLFFGITTAFAALLLGIAVIYVSNARGHLEQQLDAHANETATALALSIGALMGSLDPSLVNTLVNPVFDRGHFESIEVRSSSGAQVFARHLQPQDIDLPRWFIALVEFDGPKGESLIMAGWRQLGKVTVRVYPQYAYLQLWDTAIATSAWLGILFALALLAMRYYLAGILRPLRQIEQAAVAISNRQFVTIDIKPRARELQRVTHAINALSSKIREAIEQESMRAEQLREEAFDDSITGQLNRRGFEQAVSSSLGEGGEVHSGSLALFSVSGLEEVNRVFGLSRGNEILRRLADTLAEPGNARAAAVGRWQGPTLATFLSGADPQAAVAWAEGVCTTFAGRLRVDGLPNEIAVRGGMAHFAGGDPGLRSIGQAAEDALSRAGRLAAGTVVAAQTENRGAGIDLKLEIESAIANGRIPLLSQNVTAIADGKILHAEIFSSLTGSDGKSISAAKFVPVASQYGLLPSLDRKVLERIIAAMDRIGSLPQMISLNLSIQSVASPEFRTALRGLLATRKHADRRLVFEVTGYAASRSPDLIQEFADEVREFGANVAFDNFELDRNSVAAVHRILPAYVKIAPSFTQQIGTREDLRFMVEALLRMLRPLEVPLIAQGVEHADAIPVLAGIGIAACQGYASGRPEPVAF